ncbi:ion transporter [Alkalinema sp. FACHB-956]|uniref:ion transporter n=1 Tax=Alkalinema sp. FACHB-956 TaxID=2692768 RepID=UPI0016895CD4|nr:ion transporter [Alkalinema sp. FACHB-956]MBD2329867.1 ion transporter [Alkalinema sp. FACHB-956]
MTFRERVASYLEDIETPIGRVVNLLITGLVLLSSAIFVAETYALPESVKPWLDQGQMAILGLFVLEYGLRFWCSDRKVKFVFSIYSIIDLLAIVPFLLGNSNGGFLRIFRWIRILRLIRFFGGKTIFGYVSSEDVAIFTRILFTIFSIIFVYAGLIYQVEHTSNPQAFATFLDSIYFCVTTITTAGFGDITPISQMGRFLTILMSITGLIFIPWQLGDLVRRLVKTGDQVQIICRQCGWSIHDADARFCKVCGTELPVSSPSPEPLVSDGEPELDLPRDRAYPKAVATQNSKASVHSTIAP